MSPSTLVPSSETPYASVAMTSPVTVTEVASSHPPSSTMTSPSTVAPPSTQSAPEGTSRLPETVWLPRSSVQVRSAAYAGTATTLPPMTRRPTVVSLVILFI